MLRLPILLTGLTAALARAADPQPDPRVRLLDGVRSIASIGTPGIVAVFGPDAVPLVAGRVEDDVRAPVVALGRLGKGAIVAFGHGGYFSREALDAHDGRRFLANCVRWAAHEPARTIRVGVAGGRPEFVEFLLEFDYDVRALTPKELSSETIDVLFVCDVDRLRGTDVGRLEDFVTRGGGLFVAQTPWGWKQLNPGKSLALDLAGNTLLAKAGLAWVDGTLRTTAPKGFAADELPAVLNASNALDLLTKGAVRAKLDRRAAAQVRWSVLAPLPALPADDTLLRPRLVELEKRAAGTIPRHDAPLKDDAVMERIALVLGVERALQAAPELVEAHPAAEAFPGGVPRSAPRVKRSVTIDSTVGGWHSTGTYAAPGEVVVLRCTSGQPPAGAYVQIGAHTDDLMNEDTWSRAPGIVTKRALVDAATRVASPFGGLVYVLIRDKSGARLTFEIENVVEAPRFVLGETKNEEWKSRLRGQPAPWAELATRKVVLTVPSRVVRDLDDPAALMQFWDEVLDACADLGGIPRERPRPERYVTDEQISAGYMHSGYPIMTHLDVAPTFVDLAKLRANTQGCGWGFYHELGHNHQESEWTFEGTGEVTNNLFALYVLDTVVKAEDERTSAAQCRQRFDAYRAGGTKYEEWKKDPFLALGFFREIQRAFGWKPFQEFFAEAVASKPADEPKTDLAKRTSWLVRMSRLTGRDLTPWFALWNVPVEPGAAASLTRYPPWIADGYPPK